MEDQQQHQSKKLRLEDVEQVASGTFRPSQFMRARRPELFSDSKVISEPRLTREVFRVPTTHPDETKAGNRV